MQQAAGHGSYYAFLYQVTGSSTILHLIYDALYDLWTTWMAECILYRSRMNTMGKALGVYEREGASDQLQLLIRKVACICTCELDRQLLLLTACFWTGPDEGKCSTQLSVVKVICTDRAGNAIDGGIGKAFCVQGYIYQARNVLLCSDTTLFRGVVSI